MSEKIELESRPVFPFTSIVGQEEMKLSLILNVIDPKIGGVMVMGDRGTGKSTTVRALSDLLPDMKVVANDPFNSDPSDPELMSEEIANKGYSFNKIKLNSIWQVFYFMAICSLLLIRDVSIIDFLKCYVAIEIIMHTVNLILLFVIVKKYEQTILV